MHKTQEENAGRQEAANSNKNDNGKTEDEV